MIPNETKVLVDMENADKRSVIALLNELGGTVVKELIGYKKRLCYLVAYDVKHIAAIERAVELDERNGLGTMFFKVLGKMRAKEFPGDERYYLLAYANEIKPD